jgi:hypothetical protein
LPDNNNPETKFITIEAALQTANVKASDPTEKTCTCAEILYIDDNDFNLLIL